MINLLGHLVLNIALTIGAFGCLYRVHPFLAAAVALYAVREVHGHVLTARLRAVEERLKKE